MHNSMCNIYIDTDISFLKSSKNISIYKIDDLYPFYENSKKCMECSDYTIGPYTHLFQNISNKALNNKKNLCILYSAVPTFYEISNHLLGFEQNSKP